MTKTDKLTEEKIFDAATQIFEEKGLAETRMQEIADRAGINKALLHYYFRSKDKLFDAVFEKLGSIMFDKLFACIDNDLPLEEKLSLFYTEHINFLQKHPRLPAFILAEVNQRPERIQKIFTTERLLNIRNHFFKQLDRDMNSGAIREIDKFQLLINIVGLSIFPFAAREILQILLEHQPVSFDEFVEQRKSELPQFIMKAVETK